MSSPRTEKPAAGRWRRMSFDITIIDHMINGLSGRDIARRICSMPKLAETKLVLLSSTSQAKADRAIVEAPAPPRCGIRIIAAHAAASTAVRDWLIEQPVGDAVTTTEAAVA